MDGVVAVFVLDGIFIGAGAQNALLLRVNHHARAPVFRRAFEQVAVGVHRDPVEVVIELGNEAVFAITSRAVGRRMRVNRVGVNAADAARQRVAQLNVNAPAGGALDGDLGAFATVFRRINREAVGRACRRLFPVSTASHGVDAVKNQRRQPAVALADGRLDNAVVERPSASIVGDGHSSVGFGFGDNRRAIGGTQQRRSQGHKNKSRREESGPVGRKTYFHVMPDFTGLLIE